MSDEEIRDDLAEVLDRRRRAGDEARPEAVERRRASGRRTARENVEDLVDPGSFVEYGRLALAAQRARRELDELITRTPADGLIGGTARINGELFGDAAACAVLSYDYTVLAGTQGAIGHRKKDRLFELIERMRLPTVFLAEGGGGRPGDTDHAVVSALDTRAFALWGRLSGQVPRIAIVAGRCFAGNAVIAGASDLIVSAGDIALGMGGPAMVEGGGLGTFEPEAIGPLDVQSRNGVVDVVATDEAEAVAITKRLIGYFQGALPKPGSDPAPGSGVEGSDPNAGSDPAPGSDVEGSDRKGSDPTSAREASARDTALRTLIPARRRRAYDVRTVVEAVADSDSVTFLREAFAPEMVVAFARLEGRPIGVIANNPMYLAGAITSSGADKAARHMQLCDAFGLPILSLIDTPGMMVGPEAEETALVRHCSRLFVAGAALRVPFVALILRKAYGLGAQAMAAGSMHEPLLTIGWPTAELGAMGLEGAVKLGFKRELDAIADPDERARRLEDMVAHAHEHGKALNAATLFELDDVIDPADTRRVVSATFAAAAPAATSGRFVDTW
ncbi:MAG: acyl-CoA carboxylase subunit beta [Solirubrobacterales bacterium]